MTRDELLAQIARAEAHARAIKSEADRHNDEVGLLGRLFGQGVNLQAYNPMVSNLALNTAGITNPYKGDHPDYYDTTRQLFDYRRQLETLDAQEKNARLATQRQAILDGKTASDQSSSSPPVAEGGTKMASSSRKAEAPQWMNQLAENARTSLPLYETAGKEANHQASTTSAKRSNNVLTKPTTAEPKREKPTYKQDVSVPTVAQQTDNEQPLAFGNDVYAIPSDGFTSDNNAYGAPITIDPVSFQGDNGGVQHGAMNALYQNTPATFGQMLAFSNLMQGRRDFGGGVGAMTQTMQDFDKMNAYAAQGDVAGRVQDLVSKGYGMNEARYLALSEYGLQNGYDRMAVGATMPEYAKHADERTKREMDTLAAMGGTYQASGGLGYTPLGINAFHSNGDGTMDTVVNGQRVSNIPMEYALSGIYGAIKGDGSGASNSASRWVNEHEKAWQYGSKLSNNDVNVAKMQYGVSSGAGSAQQKEDTLTRYYNQELGKALGKAEAAKRGNVSGYRRTY